MAEPTSLNFDRAEFGDPSSGAITCRSCQAGLSGEYFLANGHPLCPSCRQRMEGALRGAGNLGQAALYGLGGAAAGGALVWAVRALLHLQIGIVAVVVGILVGKAIRAGAGGVGGRRYQILALILTYLGICGSYVPTLLSSMAAKAPGGLEAGHVITAIAFSLGMPFFMLRAGVSGLLSLVILAIGLWEAWKYTRGSQIHFTGPFQAGAAAATS